jgi:glycosyltransferase involved in cell wall biosynthesis
VASNIPVIDEIVTDGEDGLLVAPENPQAIAYAVLRVLSDAGLRTRLVAAGKRTLATRFDEDELLARVRATYARALAGQR